MAIFKDYSLDSLDGDLLIKNGDFVVAPSDDQHIHDLLNDSPGWWHEFPYVGVGLVYYQKGNINITHLSSIIMSQLKNDGYKTRLPQINFNAAGEILSIVPNAYRPK